MNFIKIQSKDFKEKGNARMKLKKKIKDPIPKIIIQATFHSFILKPLTSKRLIRLRVNKKDSLSIFRRFKNNGGWKNLSQKNHNITIMIIKTTNT